MSLQLKTDIWVQALAKRANAEGCYSSVERIGDKERGDVLVKVIHGNGDAAIYGRVFNLENESVFRRLPEGAPVKSEQAAQEYAAKRIVADPDIWIVEVLDRKGRHFITERILPDVDPFE